MSKRPRVTRVPVALPEPDATRNWMRGIRLSGFAIMVLVLLVLCVVVLAPSLRVWVDQRKELAALEAAVAEQKKDVARLDRDRARWDDPHYIETQARERLFYMRPGEASFLVIDDGASAADDAEVALPPVSAELQSTEVDWVSGLFVSVMSAGLTDAPPEELVPDGEIAPSAPEGP